MRKILPKILAELTGAPRYLPDIEWSSKSWTHNVFRVYELIFWRRFGIRPEMSSINEDGRVFYACHSWESVFALAEHHVRNFFSEFRFKPFKIYIPVLQTPSGIPVFASPYLFAIAFDAPSGESAQSTLTTVSTTHVCTGSNLILFGGLVDQAGGTTNVTGATYNSVSMSAVNSSTNTPGNDGTSYLFLLTGPSTGSNTFQGTRTTATNAFIAGASSYSGAKQTGQPDASAANGTTSATIAGTVTTIADNCWTVMVGYDRTEFPGSAGAGSTQRTTNNLGQLLIVDSNSAKTPAGSVTVNITATAAGNHSFAVASFAPFTGSGATTVVTPTLLTLMVG